MREPEPISSGVTKQRRNDMTTLTQTYTGTRSDIMALGLAALAGILLLATAGFAQASIAHNAAHDARHAVAFPCH